MKRKLDQTAVVTEKYDFEHTFLLKKVLTFRCAGFTAATILMHTPFSKYTYWFTE